MARYDSHWSRKWLIGTKCVVDKLMDGSVGNLKNNPSGCPQVAAQAAHELVHDELFGFSTTRFLYLISGGELSWQRGPPQSKTIRF